MWAWTVKSQLSKARAHLELALARLPFPTHALRNQSSPGIALHAFRERVQAPGPDVVAQDPGGVDSVRSRILLDHHALVVGIDAGRAEEIVAVARVEHDLEGLHLRGVEGIEGHVIEPSPSGRGREARRGPVTQTVHEVEPVGTVSIDGDPLEADEVEASQVLDQGSERRLGAGLRIRDRDERSPHRNAAAQSCRALRMLREVVRVRAEDIELAASREDLRVGVGHVEVELVEEKGLSSHRECHRALVPHGPEPREVQDLIGRGVDGGYERRAKRVPALVHEELRPQKSHARVEERGMREPHVPAIRAKDVPGR